MFDPSSGPTVCSLSRLHLQLGNLQQVRLPPGLLHDLMRLEPIWDMPASQGPTPPCLHGAPADKAPQGCRFRVLGFGVQTPNPMTPDPRTLDPIKLGRHLAEAVEVGTPDAAVPRERVGHGQQGGLAAHAQVQQHG